MLLQLPESCLLAVLQFCADDTRSLFSAARAHSRLHAAAVASLHSITADATQQQLRSLLLYLPRHGQHINSMSVSSGTLSDQSQISYRHRNYTAPRQQLYELPALLQLSSLTFENLDLQLQPDSDSQGVLCAGVPLRQLVLRDCSLKGGFPGDVLSHLTRLTHLELLGKGTLQDSTALQHAHKLTALQDLRLELEDDDTLTADALKGLDQLTHLYVCFGNSWFHPASLTGKTKLCHLGLHMGLVVGGREGTAALLAEIAQLQQLTFLAMGGLLKHSPPSVASYSALTASSCLQHLDLSDWNVYNVDERFWQHMFPADRHMPSLQVFTLGGLWMEQAPAAGVAPLVTCCPNLRQLKLSASFHQAELLAPLSRLTSLQQIDLGCSDDAAVGVVAGLTGLRDVEILSWRGLLSETALLQLVHLRHLTRLQIYNMRVSAASRTPSSLSSLTLVSNEDGGKGPVWRQVLQYCLDCSNPEVVQLAQQTAAELAAAS